MAASSGDQFIKENPNEEPPSPSLPALADEDDDVSFP
jgi:hypothetical protein